MLGIFSVTVLVPKSPKGPWKPQPIFICQNVTILNWNPVFCGIWVQAKVRYLIQEVERLVHHPHPPPSSLRGNISWMTQSFVSLWQIAQREKKKCLLVLIKNWRKPTKIFGQKIIWDKVRKMSRLISTMQTYSPYNLYGNKKKQFVKCSLSGKNFSSSERQNFNKNLKGGYM